VKVLKERKETLESEVKEERRDALDQKDQEVIEEREDI